MLSLKTKWEAIYAQAIQIQPKPAAVLLENEFLLPKQGTALDLACGLGANALFLAERGLVVSAWDVSENALMKLRAIADHKGITIDTQAKEIDHGCFQNCCFDVIVVSRFLDQTLTNAIIGALKVGGLLFYQTYTRVKATADGPTNAKYLLAQQELLKLFAPLQVIYYRDNALVGDLQSGLRNEAQFIGRKS